MGTNSSTPEGISLADFTFSAEDEMIACPEGQQPQRIKTGKKGGQIVHFNKETCDSCLRQSVCPVKRLKRSATISYDAKALRLARRRAKEKTEAFREIYRFRAGAEATMSDLDRITGIKHLRVRGMRQVRLAAVLKATGLNILRATPFRNRRRGPKNENEGSSHPLKGAFALIEVVKEQYNHLRADLRELLKVCSAGNDRIGDLMPVAV